MHSSLLRALFLQIIPMDYLTDLVYFLVKSKGIYWASSANTTTATAGTVNTIVSTTAMTGLIVF